MTWWSSLRWSKLGACKRNKKKRQTTNREITRVWGVSEIESLLAFNWCSVKCGFYFVIK